MALRDEILFGQRGTPWLFTDGRLLFGRRVYVPATSHVLPIVLAAAHDGGHEVQKTLHRLRADFHVPRLVAKIVGVMHRKTVPLASTALGRQPKQGEDGADSAERKGEK